MECGVDIICMSWTIETSEDATLGGKKNEPISRLQEAIKEANSRGIIMFCSASDQGGSSKVHCYPGAFQNQCIRIGSSSSSDNASVWVNPSQVDFLLPGERILIRDSDGTSEYQTGSSFATAVAAGLGGLLIYCTLVLGMGSPPSSGKHIEAEEEDPDQEDEVADTDAQHETDDETEGSRCENTSGHFGWNRQLMVHLFKHMSVPGDKNKGKLVKPEDYFIERLKKQLNLDGGLGKLSWDTKFKDGLTAVLEELKVSVFFLVFFLLPTLGRKGSRHLMTN
jgi:hypothetical protein